MVRNSEKLEYKIIKYLIKNARTSFTNIARKLDITEGAVRKKVKKLEKKGVIKGYRAIINYKKIGYKLDVIIGVDTTPEGYLKTIKNLKKMKEVKQLWTSTGDHMIMLRGIFRNQKELEEFVEGLNRKREITKVCPAILVEEIK